MELKYHIFGNFKQILKKLFFEHFFRTRKSKNSVFRGSVAEVEISRKILEICKSAQGGRTSCGNRPKPIFWSLGGPCGQNESYTSLTRPFSKKLSFGEVGAFLADLSEIPFWSVCGYVTSREKKLHSKENNFFVEVSSGKCLLGSYA